MEKLNKTFAPGQVVSAADLNAMTAKTDELVEASSTVLDQAIHVQEIIEQIQNLPDGQAVAAQVAQLLVRMARSEDAFGPYTRRAPLQLQVGMDNMAIDAATGKPVAKQGWAISKPFSIVRGNEYKIKVGTTDGSVWAAAKQTVVPAWDEEVKDPETGEVIDIIHHPAETYYSKKVQLNAGAELPEDGYLRVLGMPQDFDMVVSYHKATADTVIEVLRDGLTANVCTQVGEVDTTANERIDANMENVSKALVATPRVIDAVEYRIGQYPMTLLGHGVPSASVRPVNLGNDANTGLPLPWLGTPEFVGQQYINLDVSSGGLYYAKPTIDAYGNITALAWCNANS